MGPSTRAAHMVRSIRAWTNRHMHQRFGMTGVETISDIAPLHTRFRYATYPEIEWGRIEAQTIPWPSAHVEGGRIGAQVISFCECFGLPRLRGRIETHHIPPPPDPPVRGLLRVC